MTSVFDKLRKLNQDQYNTDIKTINEYKKLHYYQYTHSKKFYDCLKVDPVKYLRFLHQSSGYDKLISRDIQGEIIGPIEAAISASVCHNNEILLNVIGNYIVFTIDGSIHDNLAHFCFTQIFSGIREIFCYYNPYYICLYNDKYDMDYDMCLKYVKFMIKSVKDNHKDNQCIYIKTALMYFLHNKSTIFKNIKISESYIMSKIAISTGLPYFSYKNRSYKTNHVDLLKKQTTLYFLPMFLHKKTPGSLLDKVFRNPIFDYQVLWILVKMVKLR